MKKLLLLLSVFAFIGCSTKTATVTMKINSPDSITIVQRQPLYGLLAFGTDTITVAGDTTLVEEIQIDGTSPYQALATVGNNTPHSINLVLEADGNISVDLSPTGFVVSDQGQRLYDSLIKSHNPYKYEWVSDFTAAPLDKAARVLQSNFDSLAAAEKVPFETLLAQGKISKAFLDFVSMETDYYKALSLAKIVRSYTSRNDDPEFAKLFTSLVAQYPITAQSLHSPSATMLARMYSNHSKAFTDPSYKNPKFKHYAQYERHQMAALEEICSDPQAVMPLLGYNLLFKALNNNTHDLVIDSLISEFNAKYADNKFIPYFKRFLDESLAYQTAIKAPFGPEVHIVEDTVGVTTFQGILDKFKGQDLFIDFWFTTCGACVEEFAHAQKVHQFLKENQITPLFISIDRPELDQEWKNAIKYHKLDGYHVRTSRAVHVDMNQTHQINLYPTYMIVNKDGEIVEARAKRPSSGDELFKQIKDKLGK